MPANGQILRFAQDDTNKKHARFNGTVQSTSCEALHNTGGVVLASNEGTVVMQTGRGEYLVKVGEVAFALANGQVFMLPAVPDVLLYNQTPSPENCD